MKKIVAIILNCITMLMFSGCKNVYTDSEIKLIQETFQSFENKCNFVIEYFDCIWLMEKKVDFDELTYKGEKIDRLLGCDDKYCYISYRNKSESNDYTIHFLQVDYDTLEMEEIGSVKNLKEKNTSAGRVYNGKLYFSDGSRYGVYDIKTKECDWFKYDSLIFWSEIKDYDFEISNEKNDSIICITNIQTGEKKQVSWKKDLGAFKEGIYIQSFDGKLEIVKSGFVDATEKDGVCYFLGLIPLDSFIFQQQAVIFAYDFEIGELSYYSTVLYDRNEDPILTIIDRS